MHWLPTFAAATEHGPPKANGKLHHQTPSAVCSCICPWPTYRRIREISVAKLLQWCTDEWIVFLIFQILILLFGLLSFCSYAFLSIWRRNDERDDEFLPYSWEDEFVYKVQYRCLPSYLCILNCKRDLPGQELILSRSIDFVRHLLILVGCVGGRRTPPSHLNHIQRGGSFNSCS